MERTTEQKRGKMARSEIKKGKVVSPNLPSPPLPVSSFAPTLDLVDNDNRPFKLDMFCFPTESLKTVCAFRLLRNYAYTDASLRKNKRNESSLKYHHGTYLGKQNISLRVRKNGKQKRATCFSATLLENQLKSDQLRALPPTFNLPYNKSGRCRLRKIVAERREYFL